MKQSASGRISRVTFPDPAWRYLILFQSWRQFISWSSLMGATSIFVGVAIWLVGDCRLILETMAWAPIGGALSLLFATKAQFAIRRAVRSERAEIERLLHDFRYVEQSAMGQEKRFGQELPAWLCWGDCDVTIAVHGEVLVCTGPQLVIRRMRRALLHSC